MKLILLAALAVASYAQQPNIEAEDDPRIPRYRFRDSVTASSGTALTVQGNGRQTSVYAEKAEVYCSAAGTVTTVLNATAATTTAGTVTGPLNTAANGVSSVVVPSVYTASNYSGGTVTASWACAAGETLKVKMTPFLIPAGETSAVNFTVTATPATGTADFSIQIQWRTALFNAAQ